ncbi:MAG: hypothetical protein M1829_001076 [Trizodia sp. TS-e1964]|nr:MAG: hypothetical protein M1829_001076 [Trizodia sp. TS-e1964]
MPRLIKLPMLSSLSTSNGFELHLEMTDIELSPISNEAPSWHAKFPKPRAPPDGLNLRTLTVAGLLKAQLTKTPGKDFLVIDVRQPNYQGGSIKGSLNLPAETFYHSRESLYALLRSAGVKFVVFYCDLYNNRSPRCASWFNDFIQDISGSLEWALKTMDVGNHSMSVFLLQGGLKAWVKGGARHIEEMDGFDRGYWLQLLREDKRAELKNTAPSAHQDTQEVPVDQEDSKPDAQEIDHLMKGQESEL